MDFLKQLLGNKSKGNPPPSFEELIANVADSPTAANRNAVYRRVATVEKLGLQLVNRRNDLPIGVPILAGPNTQLHVIFANIQGGYKMLMVFCDVQQACAAFPDLGFVEIDAKTVLKMALQDPLCDGILLRNCDAKDSWCGIPLQDIRAILEGQYV